MQALCASGYRTVRIFGSRFQGSMTLNHAYSSNADNHYKVLELPQNATKGEIKNAFVKLSKKYHPDSNQGSRSGGDEFIKVCAAYEILGNKKKRAKYDLEQLKITHPHLDKDDPMRKYYADGTIYSGEWNGHTMERRFSNAQIAIGLIVFSFVAGFIQVKVVRFFDRRREKRAEAMHQDALRHLERERELLEKGEHPTQLEVAKRQRSKRRQAETSDDELIQDVAPVS